MGIKVIPKRNEKIDFLLKRFKKACEDADIVKDYKRHSVYEKPSDRRKREESMRQKNAKRKKREPKQDSAVEKFRNL